MLSGPRTNAVQPDSNCGNSVAPHDSYSNPWADRNANGKFAYVTNEGSNSGSVSAYTINATSGALTQVKGSIPVAKEP